MMTLPQAMARLVTGQHLDQEEAWQVMTLIMTGQATDAQIGGYLVALRMKGETVAEIAGSARAMREQALHVAAPGTVVDTCGTGGDGSGTFNISTAAAFVVAACGITVAKHGNRSISSKCGSADVLMALGVNIDAPPAVVEACLQQVGMGFLFAPKHHGAMKYAMGPRKELGIRTLFNLLGPLTNPAGAPHQVLGVFEGRWTEPMARVLGLLGSKRAMVVHGSDGLDEITTTGPTQISELLADGRVVTHTLDPLDLAIPRAVPAQLQGGDAAANAVLLRGVLAGERGPHRDIVLLNAAAALTVCGLATGLADGLAKGGMAIDDGRAKQKLDHLISCSNQPM